MAITKALTKAATSALTKGSEKALSKSVTNAVTKAATEAATKATTRALTKSLTGAGMSSLAPKAGSTLDGILGKSSGLVLQNAPRPTLAKITDGQYNTVGDLLRDGLDLNDVKTLAPKSYETMTKGAREIATIKGDAIDGQNTLGVKTKSNLPMLNRNQYYEETLGRVGRDGSMTSKDVPDFMQSHLTNDTNTGNDSILREFFGDNDSDISTLYDRYHDIASGSNANEVFTPENIDDGLRLAGKAEESKVNSDLAETLFGGKRNIKIDGGAGRAKEIKVGRQMADMGVDDAAAAAATETTNPALADEVASLRDRLSSSGAGGQPPAGGTTTSMPGSDGFNVKLKTGDTTNIPLQSDSAGSTRRQRAVRKLDDMTAKSMNSSAKQYKNVVGKSGSIDGHYKTVAERMRAEKIDQANVAQKAQAALSLREDIKQSGLQYADANGITIDLSGIDNTIGMSPTQKRKLAELGLGLDDMLGGRSVVKPSQAEDIYKTLRDYAYNWSDSKDAVTKMAGEACKKEADAVRDLIDNTMDNINVDYKTPLLEAAAKNGEDPAYLRKLATKSNFKFSDLRKDQSDWVTINDLSGNKMPNDPTLNVFGVDTGMPNPFTAGAEKIKEKVYERMAGGNYSGGGGGAGVPPTGAPGPDNFVNFSSAAPQTSRLGSLIGRGKNAALIGGGLLGGLLLGGGGQNNAPQSPTMAYQSALGAENDTQDVSTPNDPYYGLTIGGYDYYTLENGYIAALTAGDTDAAKLILNMMEMIEAKADRYAKANPVEDKKSGGIADKQRAAMNVLEGLMNNYEAQGPIGGRFTQFMNAITGGGYSPDIAAYDAGAAGSLGTIIKALGDTGALSEGDQKRALELLPKTTDSPAAAERKYQQLMLILQGAGS